VIKFVLLGTETCFYISEALPIGYLSEGHAKILVETGETFYLVIALIAIDASAECVQGQKVHDLRKYQFAGVHNSTPPELFQESAGNFDKISNR